MEDVSFQSETKILFKKYKVKRKISQIDFKKVYFGKKIIDNELVAIKVEKKKYTKSFIRIRSIYPN